MVPLATQSPQSDLLQASGMTGSGDPPRRHKTFTKHSCQRRLFCSVASNPMWSVMCVCVVCVVCVCLCVCLRDAETKSQGG